MIKQKLLAMGAIFTGFCAGMVAIGLMFFYTLIAGAAGLKWDFFRILQVTITGLGSGAFFGIWCSAVVWYYCVRGKL